MPDRIDALSILLRAMDHPIRPASSVRAADIFTSPARVSPRCPMQVVVFRLMFAQTIVPDVGDWRPGMEGGGGKSAKDISVAETLELLDNGFSAVSKAFDNQQFALWVGSGISFLRAPSLGKLIALALEHLRVRITTNDASDRFAVTLKAALAMAGLSGAGQAAIQYGVPFDTWLERDAIVGALWGKYSRFLDLRIAGEDDDYLVWTAVDVRKEYGQLEDPDCEHLAIAILVLEGAVSKIASANWDGL